MIGKLKKVPARVGSMSLIGVGGKPPYNWGNYFYLNYTGPKNTDPWRDGPRVANMWAENLTALVKDKTLEDGLIEVIDYNNEYCIVVDKRVPPDYLHNDLCFTGGRSPCLEIVEEMYRILGDPNNEIEQYINPKKYWEDRGWEYYDKGTMSKKLSGKTRELKGTFSFKEAEF